MMGGTSEAAAEMRPQTLDGTSFDWGRGRQFSLSVEKGEMG
jgi:hypothetical protein